MVTPDDIKGWITEKLPCDYIELDGDGQHFNAVIVSPSFSGKNMIQQHRLVYDALGTPHARGNPRAVDENLHPRRLGHTLNGMPC